MVMVLAKAAALALLGTAGASSATFTLPDFTASTPDTIQFLPMVDYKCGLGNQLYYAVITPAKTTTYKKFWIETMGGAICFSEASCQHHEYGVWLDLKKILVRYADGKIPPSLGTPDSFFNLLKTGIALPMSQFRPLGAAYLPNHAGGPLDGQVGIWYPSCTGDAQLGNYLVKYNSTATTIHTGAAGYLTMIEAFKAKYPTMEQFSLIGASGSGVSAFAWAPVVADMFPSTQIRVFGDSAMHVFPASSVFTFFWEKVQWSPNPNANHSLATMYKTGSTPPSFDWRKSTAMSDMLKKYNGRIKVLYLACAHDEIVAMDRELLCGFAGLTDAGCSNTAVTTVTEMWAFMENVVKNSPAGYVYSYISSGKCHQQTRKGWEKKINASDPNDPGPQIMTELFLKDTPHSTANHWCCNKTPPAAGSGISSTAASSKVTGSLALTLATQAMCNDLASASGKTGMKKMLRDKGGLPSSFSLSNIGVTVTCAATRRLSVEERRLGTYTGTVGYDMTVPATYSGSTVSSSLNAVTAAQWKTSVTSYAAAEGKTVTPTAIAVTASTSLSEASFAGSTSLAVGLVMILRALL